MGYIVGFVGVPACVLTWAVRAGDRDLWRRALLLLALMWTLNYLRRSSSRRHPGGLPFGCSEEVELLRIEAGLTDHPLQALTGTLIPQQLRARVVGGRRIDHEEAPVHLVPADLGAELTGSARGVIGRDEPVDAVRDPNPGAVSGGPVAAARTVLYYGVPPGRMECLPVSAP